MGYKGIILIALAVVGAHLALFWLVADRKVLPKARAVPRPTFIAKSGEVVDAETGEKVMYREFTVSTRLSDLPSASDAP